MATLQTTIPDDLPRQVHATARARGIPVHFLVEEAIESEALKDLPWRA